MQRELVKERSDELMQIIDANEFLELFCSEPDEFIWMRIEFLVQKAGIELKVGDDELKDRREIHLVVDSDDEGGLWKIKRAGGPRDKGRPIGGSTDSDYRMSKIRSRPSTHSDHHKSDQRMNASYGIANEQWFKRSTGGPPLPKSSFPT